MSAKPDTWMPLVIGDYLKDTSRLTTEQHGAYLLLIMSYWTDGAPPDDDEELATITRLALRDWKRQRPKLARFFQIGGGVWRHKRIETELADATDRKASYSARGSAGASARWGKDASANGSGNSSGNSSSIGPANSPRIGKAKAQALLKQCPSPSPREVEGPKEPSTLSSRERSEARRDGASEARDEPEDTERGWLVDAAAAEAELLRCKRTDPDLASELAVFIDVAKGRAAELRRARLAEERAA